MSSYAIQTEHAYERNCNHQLLLLSLLGTTVFRGKFFQIPRASLPNSAAHGSKFSTYSNLSSKAP